MKPTIRKTPLERAIDEQLDALQRSEPGSNEQNDHIDRFIKLHKLQAELQRPRVSPDTVVLAITNLAGILLILNYEKLGIVTSKATSLAIKVR